VYEALVNWLKVSYGFDAIVLGWGRIVFQYGILAVFERLRPAELNQPLIGIWTNVKITLVFLLLTPAVNALPGLAANRLVQNLGGSWLQLDLPAITSGYPIGIAWLAVAVLAFLPLFVSDFFYYWFHRAQHMNRWLWQQHQIHHSDKSLNVTTSARHHWLEIPLRSFLMLVPMNLLVQMTPIQSVMIGTFLGVWGYIIHMNMRLGLGPIAFIFLGPQGHRIHHSILAQHRDKNFAAFFPIWDVLFGTFYKPKAGEYPPTGVEDVPSDPSMKEILFGPFIAWRRMFSEERAQVKGDKA